MLTGFTVDGQTQPLAQDFPVTSILPRGTLSSSFVLRNLVTPMSHTLGFSGVDATGQNWSRQVSVLYTGLPSGAYQLITPIATPLTVTQNVNADPSCQWPVQLHLDDTDGSSSIITNLLAGSVDVSSQIVPIFGTTRLDAYGSLSGTLCLSGITPPAIEPISFIFDDGSLIDVTVSLVGPPANPIQMATAPSTVTLAAAPGQPAQAILTIGLSDPTQPWTASVFPANRTTSWLNVSQLSATGPAQVALTADGTGAFEPGAYPATIVLQSPNAIPQTVSVPVMMVFGGSTSGTSITGVANTASPTITNGAPGMRLTVTGTQLANSTATTPAPTRSAPFYAFTLGGVSATVNGLAAPVLSISPTQLVIQIPYEAGAGPAVLGVNNNGQIAGFQFQMAPSAPAIYDDGNGNLAPSSTAKRGASASVLFNGAGDVPFNALFGPLDTAFLPELNYQPILPVSVTVGGVQAFLTANALSTSVLGETQVNFTVPASLTPGVQPVIVTVGGVASQAVNLTVQ